MRFDTYAKQVAHQYLSNDDLALIRKTAVEMMANEDHTIPVGTVLLKLLNHINAVTIDNNMVDVLALQEKLTDRETRLREMEKAYFEVVFERDRLKEKLGVRI